MPAQPRKEVIWVGSCRADLAAFPQGARRVLGFAHHVAQLGGRHADARPLRGFGGGGVLEVIEDYDRRTFRLMYTVRLGDRVYALHAFKKKSTRGVQTPKHEMDVVRRRLREAEEIHRRWLEDKAGGEA
jgi:phage-related protein